MGSFSEMSHGSLWGAGVLVHVSAPVRGGSRPGQSSPNLVPSAEGEGAGLSSPVGQVAGQWPATHAGGSSFKPPLTGNTLLGPPRSQVTHDMDQEAGHLTAEAGCPCPRGIPPALLVCGWGQQSSRAAQTEATAFGSAEGADPQTASRSQTQRTWPGMPTMLVCFRSQSSSLPSLLSTNSRDLKKSHPVCWGGLRWKRLHDWNWGPLCVGGRMGTNTTSCTVHPATHPASQPPPTHLSIQPAPTHPPIQPASHLPPPIHSLTCSPT